jgi:DNA repair protein RecO (recombination protein O)
MAQIIKTQGYILHTRSFKESSLFASILTRHFGKITVLAKGCRRPKSKMCGSLEPFNKDEIIYYKRESKEVYTLSDAHVLEHYERLRQSPGKVTSILVLCEFFNKTLPHEEPDQRAFALMEKYITTIEQAPQQSVKPLTYYHLLIALSYAGVRPHCDSCVKCGTHIPSTEHIDFSIAAGGLVCAHDYDDSVIKLSFTTVKAIQTVLTFGTMPVEHIAIDEIETLIPRYLSMHLDNLVLNSLKYLQ